jgi:hypothetical protein
VSDGPIKLAHCKKKKNQWVRHNVSLPFTIKRYLKAKEEELWKFDYFTMPKSSNLQEKNPLKETKILQDIIIITIL